MSTVKKYRKKPVEVEAIQYTGTNGTDVLRFMFPDIEPEATASCETIQTLEGEMHVSVNDYVIRGVKGEYYPCKPDIFLATYTEVVDSATKKAIIGEQPVLQEVLCVNCGKPKSEHHELVVGDPGREVTLWYCDDNEFEEPGPGISSPMSEWIEKNAVATGPSVDPYPLPIINEQPVFGTPRMASVHRALHELGLHQQEITSPLERELTSLLNSHSTENGSNTPDFILSRYLLGCLDTFNKAVRRREDWYGQQSTQFQGT